jgi:hypothetical protein
MTVYQSSGNPQTLLGDGSEQEHLFETQNCINPFSGSVGTNFYKVYNESANGAAVLTFTPYNDTYTYTGLTGVASGSGANAVFTVNVSYTGYTATVTNDGDGYIATETVTILGTDVGGATTANDVTITVDTVDGNGAITGISVAGTGLWPQGQQAIFTVGPGQTEFIQVSYLPVDIVCRGNVVDGNMIVSPIQIVG